MFFTLRERLGAERIQGIRHYSGEFRGQLKHARGARVSQGDLAHGIETGIGATHGVGFKIRPHGQIAMHLTGRETHRQSNASTPGHAGPGTVDQPVIVQRHLTCLQIDRDNVGRVELRLVDALAQDKFLPLPLLVIHHATAMTARHNPHSTIAVIRIVDGEPHCHRLSRCQGPVLCILVPWHIAGATWQFAKEVTTPQVEVLADEILHVVEDGRRAAQVIDPAIRLLPTIDAIDIDAIRQLPEQLVKTLLQMHHTLFGKQGQGLDETALAEMQLFSER
jgi:hypothetical protein